MLRMLETSSRAQNISAVHEESQRLDGEICVAVIDVFRLADINAAFGSDAGDLVLQELANRFAELRVPGIAAHLGCDKFAIVLPARLVGSMGDFAKEIIAAVTAPVRCGSEQLMIGIAVGLAAGVSEEFRVALDHAQVALSEAKSRGRNEWAVYSAQLHEVRRRDQMLRDALVRAVVNNEFFTLYQPQSRADTGVVIGAEALLRWRDREGTVHSPAAFLREAEKMGIVHELDAALLERVTGDLVTLRRAGLELPKISCNVSLASLTSTKFKTAANASMGSGSQICLELVEQIMFEELTESQRLAISAFKGQGFQIAIDDFGTGHASFVSLFSVAPDVVKIDRSMLPIDLDDARRRNALAAVVSACHACATVVVAEGVETEEQLAASVDAGCDVIQGFVRHKPMEFSAFMSLLQGC